MLNWTAGAGGSDRGQASFSPLVGSDHNAATVQIWCPVIPCTDATDPDWMPAHRTFETCVKICRRDAQACPRQHHHRRANYLLTPKHLASFTVARVAVAAPLILQRAAAWPRPTSQPCASAPSCTPGTNPHPIWPRAP